MKITMPLRNVGLKSATAQKIPHHTIEFIPICEIGDMMHL
jgi:hypothetical protein